MFAPCFAVTIYPKYSQKLMTTDLDIQLGLQYSQKLMTTDLDIQLGLQYSQKLMTTDLDIQLGLPMVMYTRES